MNIPSRVNPFGYDNTVPPGYMRAEFLESTGSQYMDTGVNINGTSGAFGIFEPVGTTPNNWAISAGVYKRYSFSPLVRYQDNVGFQYAETARYPLTDGTWVSSGTQAGNLGYKLKEKCHVALNWLNDHQWSLEFNTERRVYSALPNMAGLNNTLYLFARHYETGVAERERVRIYKLQLSQGEQQTNTFIPTIDSAGQPCMLDLVTLKPFYNEATTGSDFIVGLTSAQALNLANLPATGGSMTVSLPLEAAFDDNVNRALEAAAAKGWYIPVQYRESELTTKNIDADFLESTGAQWIDTGIVPNAAVEFDMQMAYVYPLNEERGYTMFFGCVVSDSNGQFRLGHSTFYRSNVDVIESCVLESLVWFRYDAEIEPRRIYRMQTKIEPQSATVPLLFFDGKQQAYINSSATTYVYNGVISVPMGLFGRIGSGEATTVGAPLIVKKATIAKGGSVVFDALPCLDSSGVPCMYDTVSGQNFYNANTEEGATPFTVGFDTTEKAAISISKLPITTGGTLTVSLPAEAEDASTWVPTAIEIATNRGWTIITQYRAN